MSTKIAKSYRKTKRSANSLQGCDSSASTASFPSNGSKVNSKAGNAPTGLKAPHGLTLAATHYQSSTEGSPISITGFNSTQGQPGQTRGTALSTSFPVKKQVIICDYLELTVRNTIQHLAPGEAIPLEINLPYLRLVTASKDAKGNPIISGTKHFQAKYNAFLGDEAQPFATVITYPRKGGILPDYLSQIKVENRELYAKGWTTRLINLLSALRVEINNISRLDIAVDSNCVGNDTFIGIYKGYKNNIIESVGRKVYNTMHDHGNDTQGFDWGRKTSAKMLTGYIKSATIAKDGKQYVSDRWKLNGINDERVERLELKLRTDCIKRTVSPNDGLAGVDISQLENGGYLAGIMRAHLKGWFEFVPITSDSNKSRRERIQIIDWDNLSAEYLERIPTTKPTNEVWAAKHAISKGLRDADKEYTQKAAKEAIADAIAGGGAVCGESVVKVIQEHLKAVFPYAIPAQYFTGLDAKLARAIGGQVSASISGHSAKQFNISIYSKMAKAHNLEDFFTKKARIYKV